MKFDLPRNNKFASVLLRIGLASVLLYASVSSWRTPLEWVGYLPHFLVDRFDGTALLHVFSVYEATLAVWLLVGICIQLAGAVAAATFAGIILTNTGAFSSVTFRDITMVFAALALIFIEA